jgi:all-trans-retinol 13,14-reductase
MDGGSQIARLLAKEIRNRGGEVKTRREVTEMVETNGEVEHVMCSNGDQYFGKVFISNAHPAKTLELVNSELIKKVYRTRISNLENSISTFLVNIVMKPKTFPYKNYNIYYYDKEDVWNAINYTDESWPGGFALFYSTRYNQDQWADGITLMAYMRIEELRPWINTFNTVTAEDNRGPEYEKFKEEKAKILIDYANSVFPGIRENMKSHYIATPLTLRDYIGTDDGTLYGIVKDYRNPLRTFISPRTKIPNLFLTGQNLNMHGVLGTSMSAIVTAAETFGMNYLLEKIRNA